MTRNTFFSCYGAQLLSSLVIIFSLTIMGSSRQYQDKTLVAHRGASAYAPEHTLAAYQLALIQGADFVEQDLGVTRDGVLVCLHDDSLERTTNVEEIFPDRYTTVLRSGKSYRRWLLRDFTLAEIKTLDAGSWFSEEFAGATIPTWQEAINLIRGQAGLFPELKSPSDYEAAGIDMATLVLEVLRSNGLDEPATDPTTPVIIQSFDAASLRTIAAKQPLLPRVFLFGAQDPAVPISDKWLKEIAEFATGIGPAKSIISAQPKLVARAHTVGLSVTPYTFRSSSTQPFQNVEAEMRHFLFTLNVDALFTDNPDKFPRQ